MTIELDIGGYRIRIHEPHSYPPLVWPLRPFEPFLGPAGGSADITVDVSISTHPPKLDRAEVRYDAGPGLWTLCDSAEGLVLESLSPQTFQPRARALVSRDFRTMQAWIGPDSISGQVGWVPMHLFNPILEVCLLSRLALDGGVVLHASGLSLDQRAYAFTGPSGAGKSTIAQFFADRGASVFSDERVILRERGRSVHLFGTPWVGSGEHAAREEAPLAALYAIAHGTDRHCLDRTSPATMTRLILQQAFLPRWDRTCMERTVDFLAMLTSRVPCSTLAFAKRPDVVDFIQSQGHTADLALI